VIWGNVQRSAQGLGVAGEWWAAAIGVDTSGIVWRKAFIGLGWVTSCR
jgi:hypothetical protein